MRDSGLAAARLKPVAEIYEPRDAREARAAASPMWLTVDLGCGARGPGASYGTCCARSARPGSTPRGRFVAGARCRHGPAREFGGP
jgi:hypothetical protein